MGTYLLNRFVNLILITFEKGEKILSLHFLHLLQLKNTNETTSK